MRFLVAQASRRHSRLLMDVVDGVDMVDMVDGPRTPLA